MQPFLKLSVINVRVHLDTLLNEDQRGIRFIRRDWWPTPSLELVSNDVNGYDYLRANLMHNVPAYRLSFCVLVTASTEKIFSSDQIKTRSTARCISTNILLPLTCRFCLEAVESNCLDYFSYAIRHK